LRENPISGQTTNHSERHPDLESSLVAPPLTTSSCTSNAAHH